MPSIAQAATATGASLEDLSKAGFAAMSNLGLGAEDLARSFDVMAAAGKAGGFELRDMAQYLPSITALASSKGMDGSEGLAQIASALQIVRRGAGDASEAATNFSNILQKINSNDAIKRFGELGIDIQKVLKDAKANGTDPLEASLRAINSAATCPGWARSSPTPRCRRVSSRFSTGSMITSSSVTRRPAPTA
jgi:TP901 family phage tail tape measure protein